MNMIRLCKMSGISMVFLGFNIYSKDITRSYNTAPASYSVPEPSSILGLLVAYLWLKIMPMVISYAEMGILGE